MVLAAGQEVRFYASANLLDWEETGSFGGHGAQGGVWETPDLFQLPVAGTGETRWVLVVSVGQGGPAGGSGTQYFIGNFDGRAFRSENPAGHILWMDHGADFYAPQSWSGVPDGRRIVIAWMSNWDYAAVTPTAGWRSAMTVPRELSLIQTRTGPRLLQNPVRELDGLRGPVRHFGTGSGPVFGEGLGAFEAVAQFRVGAEAGCFGFRLWSGESTAIIGYDTAAARLYIDRRAGGRSDFHENFAGLHAAALTPEDGRVHIRFLVDRCSIEVFGGGGRAALTDLFFPDEPGLRLEGFTEAGAVELEKMEIYEYET